MTITLPPPATTPLGLIMPGKEEDFLTGRSDGLLLLLLLFEDETGPPWTAEDELVMLERVRVAGKVLHTWTVTSPGVRTYDDDTDDDDDDDDEAREVAEMVTVLLLAAEAER